MNRRKFLELGLRTIAATGLELILAGCTTPRIEITNYRCFRTKAIKSLFKTDFPIKKYPILLEITLVEDLTKSIEKEVYDLFGKVAKKSSRSGESLVYKDKTLDQPRKIYLEGRTFFFIDGEKELYVNSDSSGVVKVVLTPDYKSSNEIPINLNDIVDKEMESTLIQNAKITDAEIAMVNTWQVMESKVTHEAKGITTVTRTSLIPGVAKIKILTISKRKLEGLLEDLKTKGFNNNIWATKLYLKDIDSRTELSEVKLKIKGEDIPEYRSTKNVFTAFKGELLENIKGMHIGEHIKDYVGNVERSFISDNEGEIQLPVYLNGTYHIELTHPKYHFVKQTIRFDTQQPKEILMSELGTKVRVEILDKK